MRKMLGDEIKKRRLELGMSEEELINKAKEKYKNNAEQVFDEDKLSKWENNELIPNANELWILCDLLEYSILKFTTAQKSKVETNYYANSFALVEKIGTEKTDKLIEELSDGVKNEDFSRINQTLLEVYIYNKIEIPKDMALLLSLSMFYNDEEKEEYISYINSFIKGLMKMNEIEKIDKIMMERAERKDIGYLAKLHNEIVREMKKEEEEKKKKNNDKKEENDEKE